MTTTVDGTLDVLPPNLRTLRQHEPPPSEAAVEFTRPLPLDDGPHPTDPTNIEHRLAQWAAWHDELTERKAKARSEWSRAKHALDIAEAQARPKAARRASVYGSASSTTAVNAEVQLDEEVQRRRRAADQAEDRFWKIHDLLGNAEMNIDRLRTMCANSRVHDPR